LELGLARAGARARVTCVFLNFFTTALAFRSDSILIRVRLRIRGRGRVRVGG